MYLTQADILDYFAQTKFHLDFSEIDLGRLETNEHAFVVSRLQAQFNTEGWDNDPPVLIKNIVAMRVAARIFIRQLADNAARFNANENYGRWLLRSASEMLDQLVSGELDIGDDRQAVGEILVTTPAFRMEDQF